MKNDKPDQVRALQAAIIQRAKELTDEHINQGQMTRSRIMEDARAKVRLMEQKELLAAKDNAERAYQRRVQASEIQLQAEMDRNRWGLVQSVMDSVQQEVSRLAEDRESYDAVFFRLLKNGAEAMGQPQQIALVNPRDHQNYQAEWKKITAKLPYKIKLSDEICECSGGIRLVSEDGTQMVDNTFDGIILRQEDELMRIIFERLFSRVPSMGVSQHG